jgi:membrane-associated phospholipid phosphatase
MISMANNGRATRRTLVLLSSLSAVIGFSLYSYYYLDIPVASYCRSIGPLPKMIFRYATDFGKSTWYLIVSAGMFLVFRYISRNIELSNKFLFIFLSISVSGIITDIIKFIFGRYRPNALFESKQYGFTFFEHLAIKTSFPSGHSNTITALMLALYFLYPRYWILYVALSIIVISSRVALCDHYISDVVFGSFLAIVTTFYIKSIFYRNGMLTLTIDHANK